MRTALTAASRPAWPSSTAGRGAWLGLAAAAAIALAAPAAGADGLDDFFSGIQRQFESPQASRSRSCSQTEAEAHVLATTGEGDLARLRSRIDRIDRDAAAGTADAPVDQARETAQQAQGLAARIRRAQTAYRTIIAGCGRPDLQTNRLGSLARRLDTEARRARQLADRIASTPTGVLMGGVQACPALIDSALAAQADTAAFLQRGGQRLGELDNADPLAARTGALALAQELAGQRERVDTIAARAATQGPDCKEAVSIRDRAAADRQSLQTLQARIDTIAGPAAADEPEPRLNQAQRRRVQERLATLGHYGNRVDGQFGNDTRLAIAFYQRGAGVAATGRLTQAQADALLAPPVAAAAAAASRMMPPPAPAQPEAPVAVAQAAAGVVPPPAMAAQPEPPPAPAPPNLMASPIDLPEQPVAQAAPQPPTAVEPAPALSSPPAAALPPAPAPPPPSTALAAPVTTVPPAVETPPAASPQAATPPAGTAAAALDTVRTASASTPATATTPAPEAAEQVAPTQPEKPAELPSAAAPRVAAKLQEALRRWSLPPVVTPPAAAADGAARQPFADLYSRLRGNAAGGEMEVVRFSRYELVGMALVEHGPESSQMLDANLLLVQADQAINARPEARRSLSAAAPLIGRLGSGGEGRRSRQSLEAATAWLGLRIVAADLLETIANGGDRPLDGATADRMSERLDQIDQVMAQAREGVDDLSAQALFLRGAVLAAAGRTPDDADLKSQVDQLLQ